MEKLNETECGTVGENRPLGKLHLHGLMAGLEETATFRLWHRMMASEAILPSRSMLYLQLSRERQGGLKIQQTGKIMVDPGSNLKEYSLICNTKYNTQYIQEAGAIVYSLLSPSQIPIKRQLLGLCWER